MNPFGTRGAADELARLLDASPMHVGSSGALAGPLVGSGPAALAVRLRALGGELASATGPRADFRAALRTRLVAVATVQAASLTAPATAPARAALPAAVSWRERLTAVSAAGARRGSTVAAGALASVVAVGGVAVAGSQSLPGDPFYDVKRGVEALQLRAADGDVEEGTRHLDLAGTRLREVRALVLGRDAAADSTAAGFSLASAGSPLSAADASLVSETLADMDASTREGRALLTTAFRERRAPEPLEALAAFADRQSAGLERLLPSLPAGAVADAEASLALAVEVGEQADELLDQGACGPACDPTSVAPTLPPVPQPGASPGSETSDETPDEASCECAEPTPQPAPSPTAAAPSPDREPEPSSSPAAPAPEPTRSEEPSPTPSPSPTQDPLPVPVPLPSLPVPVPVPVPTITLPPLLPPPLADLFDEPAPAAPAVPVPAPAVAPLAVPPRS